MVYNFSLLLNSDFFSKQVGIIINNNFINLYCANINPENFHLRVTITQQNPKILNIFKLTKSLIYND